MSLIWLSLATPTLISAALAGEDTALVGITEDSSAAVHAAAAALGGTPGRCFHSAGVCVLHFEAAPPLGALVALPEVRYAERDRQMDLSPGAPALPEQPVSPPSDAQGTAACPDLWELALLQAETLPVRGSGAPVVAIQDTGFLLSHVELQGRVSGQYDYGDGDTVPEVTLSAGIPAHGSFIGGLIAAVPDNGVIRAGLAPQAQLNLQKIADSSGALYYSYAISAMADLAEGDLGVRVLNYSIASSNPPSGFTDAITGLGEADILLVAAAGNCSVEDCNDADNDRFALYPASHEGEHVVAVAGSLRDDGYNPYSHYGRRSVDLAAPGVDLCSLGVDSDSDAYTSAGTSYAAPLVAAAAALIWEAHPALTASEVARVLRASAEPASAWADKVRSGGRLDVADALRVAVPRVAEPANPTFDREGSLALQLSNVGADGEATLLLFHGEALELSAPDGWTLRRFGPGDALDLPDAGAWTSSGERGSVITGGLPQHSAEAVVLGIRGLQAGLQRLSVRLILGSDGAAPLNAPYLPAGETGSTDPTGYPAFDLDVVVTEAWTEDSDPPDDSGPVIDSDPGVDSSPASDTDTWDSGEDPKGGCACSGAPGRGAAAWGLLGLLLVARRRR